MNGGLGEGGLLAERSGIFPRQTHNYCLPLVRELILGIFPVGSNFQVRQIWCIGMHLGRVG